MGQGNIVLPLNFDADNKNAAITQTYRQIYPTSIIQMLTCYISVWQMEWWNVCVYMYIFFFRKFKYFLFISNACKKSRTKLLLTNFIEDRTDQ